MLNFFNATFSIKALTVMNTHVLKAFVVYIILVYVNISSIYTFHSIPFIYYLIFIHRINKKVNILTLKE